MTQPAWAGTIKSSLAPSTPDHRRAWVTWPDFPLIKTERQLPRRGQSSLLSLTSSREADKSLPAQAVCVCVCVHVSGGWEVVVIFVHPNYGYRSVSYSGHIIRVLHKLHLADLFCISQPLLCQHISGAKVISDCAPMQIFPQAMCGGEHCSRQADYSSVCFVHRNPLKSSPNSTPLLSTNNFPLLSFSLSLSLSKVF